LRQRGRPNRTASVTRSVSEGTGTLKHTIFILPSSWHSACLARACTRNRFAQPFLRYGCRA